MRRVVFIIATALSSPAAANTAGCGENAFTFAEVVEARPGERHKGAIVSVPDSLCADLVEDRKPSIGALNLLIGEPSATPRGSPGGRGGRVPALARSADLSECDPRRESAGFPGTACEPGVTNVTTVAELGRTSAHRKLVRVLVTVGDLEGDACALKPELALILDLRPAGSAEPDPLA